MNEEVLIRIEYIGFFKTTAKQTYEEISVPLNAKNALEKINRHMSDKYGIDKNFTILINNQSVSVFIKNNILKESAVFTVIPILSGG